MSIDAKDIYLSNNYLTPQEIGYNIRNRNGDISTRKFINTLDYSLDLIKLREVYERVYRRRNFGFWINEKEYTQRVINVTFKYSVKEYNRVKPDLYVKNGYNYADISDKIKDSIYVENDTLIAIVVGQPVTSPISIDVLGKYFWYENGQYNAKKNIATVVGVAELRNYLYENGFVCDGIKYIRYKRSSGSSRVGKCLFIDERLYNLMHKWEMCGLKIRNGQVVDLAALEAYIALTLSSIIDVIEINPENILVIDDYESEFEDQVVAVRADEDNKLVANPEVVKIVNSIWDGQSLMDASLFGNYKDYGMLLLRNRFFKSCCFNCNIQQFFKDNGITEISQLNGKTIATDISQIKFITTPSSIKYLKFGSLESWLLNVDPLFGVVKHEKKTHYFEGRMVQSHYQLLNTLQLSMEDVEHFLSPSLEYLNLLKTDPAVLRYHIKYPPDEDWFIGSVPLKTKNDIVYKLLGLNDKFAETKLYADFRQDLLRAYVKNIKCGHVMVNGNYSTMAGNPIEMLLSSINKFDGNSIIGTGCICSKRFQYDKLILGSRSPHVAAGNVLLVKNVECEYVNKYCNFTNEIVCINSINENILQRLSGCDFDSDTVLLTDDEILIEAAKKNYDRFLVPTSFVESKKIKRYYTNEQKSDLDIKTSENLIGEIINLSQELNTLIWDRLNSGQSWESIMPIYYDVAMLDVMSNIEIDSAKKEFAISNSEELKILKLKYHRTDKNGRQIKPKFFGHVAKQKGYYDSSKKYYCKHKTTMDYLQSVMSKFRVHYEGRNYIPFLSIVNSDLYDVRHVNYHSVNRIIDIVRESHTKVKSVFNSSLPQNIKYKEIANIRQETIDFIDSLKFGYSTMYWLIKSIESPECRDICRTIFNTLFGSPNKEFYKLISLSKEHISVLHEDPYGTIMIYGKSYSKE